MADLPVSLESECKASARILKKFLAVSCANGLSRLLLNVISLFPGNGIPSQVLRNAKGVVILRVGKAGFFFSARVGTGLIIGRLPDRSTYKCYCL